MRNLLTALALLATSTTVNAGQALWSQSPTWEVIGNTEGWCKAATHYPGTGKSLEIGLNSDGWKLFIGGVSAIPGDIYTVALAATNGASGTIVGTGLTDTSVVFDRITPRTIANLAAAQAIHIQGLDGPFSLKGSMRAISDTIDCFRAMTGELS